MYNVGVFHLSAMCVHFWMITLSVNNLSKSYGQQSVFRELTFSTSSQILGIAGRNGSGKSTLLLCIAGLLKPSAGRISWTHNGNEVPPEKLTEILGFTAPYVELYEELNAVENLQFLIDLKKLKRRSVDIPHQLGLFDALPLADKKWGALSTGERQRIKLAASSLHDPSVLCLDEPGSNLDRDGKKLISDTVERIRKSDKMIIIASNQADELALCDEIIDLDNLT